MIAAMQYAGDELDSLASARNYYGWILSYWRPYLGATVLELGAGIGTVSARLLKEPIEHLILIEPATDLFNRLHRRFADSARVDLLHGVLEDGRDRFRGLVDSIVSLNVLEHIADDRETLRAAREVLTDDGVLLLFVPAFKFLWGPMDTSFGHFRRYSVKGLAKLLRDCGFAIDTIRYMNVLGTFSWLFANHVLRKRTLTPRMVEIGDRLLIPLTARIERFISPPFGQSVMAIARKS